MSWVIWTRIFWVKAYWAQLQTRRGQAFFSKYMYKLYAKKTSVIPWSYSSCSIRGVRKTGFPESTPFRFIRWCLSGNIFLNAELPTKYTTRVNESSSVFIITQSGTLTETIAYLSGISSSLYQLYKEWKIPDIL